jgi:hypothetical protein
MTPKEIAKELFDKNYQIFLDDEDEHFVGTAKRISKQCALIAVDEIRQIVNRLQNYEEAIFWKEVRKEIEAL